MVDFGLSGTTPSDLSWINSNAVNSKIQGVLLKTDSKSNDPECLCIYGTGKLVHRNLTIIPVVIQ